MKRFSLEPLITLVRYVEAELTQADEVSFLVPNPDLGRGRYAGERLEPGLVHRPLQVWLDLAEALQCRLLTPEKIDETHIRLRFEKLDKTASWHLKGKGREKYGAASSYQRINKLEDSSFLLSYLDALKRVNISKTARVLSLGVNTGDELEPFNRLGLETCTFVGLDHSETALQAAARRFTGDNYIFINLDISRLGDSKLEPFDLIICLGTLQSPGVKDREVLRLLVAGLLKRGGSLVLGLPNGRYIDGEHLYGARMKNYAQAEMSLVVKDLAFYKKYLQQHGFKVFITGKYDLLLTAVPAQQR